MSGIRGSTQIVWRGSPSVATRRALSFVGGGIAERLVTSGLCLDHLWHCVALLTCWFAVAGTSEATT